MTAPRLRRGASGPRAENEARSYSGKVFLPDTSEESSLDLSRVRWAEILASLHFILHVGFSGERFLHQHPLVAL